MQNSNGFVQIRTPSSNLLRQSRQRRHLNTQQIFYAQSITATMSTTMTATTLQMGDSTTNRADMASFEHPEDDDVVKGASSSSCGGNVEDVSTEDGLVPSASSAKCTSASSPETRSSSMSSLNDINTMKMTEARRRRFEQEEIIAKRFVTGDELHLLRQRVLGMRLQLQEAREKGENSVVQRLSKAILRAQEMDADFQYLVSMERMEAATQAGLHEEAEKYHRDAMLARAALPQFNMAGLWIGRFGDDFHMVNISYVGDTLIAHKVTGNSNVPKGQVSFQVDLNPININNDDTCLQPIELNEESSKQWGCKFLQRFKGRGQVAAPGFQQREWVDGQLILVDKYFSFAWLPISHQVFFGRPSPELTLKMLRKNNNSNGKSSLLSSSAIFPSTMNSNNKNINKYDSELTVIEKRDDGDGDDDDEKSISSFLANAGSSRRGNKRYQQDRQTNNNNIDSMRLHLSRCWEETEHIQDDLDVSDGIFRSHEQSYYYEQNGCFE